MHVLLIHQAFAGPSDPGGTRHFELAKRAIAEGSQFTIVTSSLNYLTGGLVSKSSQLLAENWIQGIRILRVYTLATIHRSFVWRVLSFLSFMFTSTWAGLRAGPVDLVMGTSPPIFQALSAWIVALLRRRPFLLEIRDLWPEFAIDMGVLKNPGLIWLSRQLEGFLYARATHLLVNSPAYRDYLIRRGVPFEKISFIANGVETSHFDPSRKGESFRQTHQLGGAFVAMYAGALGIANDIPTLLRAAEMLRAEPHIRIVIVGDGKERATAQAMADTLELDNVVFTGPVPKADMPCVLAAADTCVAILKDIPMFRTTYPNKVFDYMAAGRPTVLAIDGVVRQVIEASGGGMYCPPGNPRALAAAILKLSRDPAAAGRMGQAARNYVVSHFDRTTQANEFIVLLRDVSGRAV